MRSADMLAVDGRPLTVVRIQKANGVKVIHGCDSNQKAREFIGIIANTVREKITDIVSKATAFSILSDGSQARKTSCEKELVLIRTVKYGGGSSGATCIPAKRRAFHVGGVPGRGWPGVKSNKSVHAHGGGL